jgi:prepilin-type N-terminal cleavage/methylation domain-containing protein
MATATRRHQRGFTLLEVMAAFGILAGVVGFVSVIWSQNIDKALNAITRRELREAGDTIFRRFLYEHHKHSDGMGGSLEDFYADWCGFKGHARERWGIYRFEMRKRLKVAAGSAAEGSSAESIFGADGTEEQDTGTPFGEEPKEGEGEIPGVTLIEITVNIYKVGEGGENPEITLTTYLKARNEEDS